jgi:hypothetical protein
VQFLALFVQHLGVLDGLCQFFLEFGDGCLQLVDLVVCVLSLSLDYLGSVFFFFNNHPHLLLKLGLHVFDFSFVFTFEFGDESFVHGNLLIERIFYSFFFSF